MSAENLPNFPEETDALIDGTVPQLPPAARLQQSCSPFAFIQAADFRLDTPCDGIAGLPTDMQDRLVRSRYIAAQRVFDAAIEHDVDFVVLPGGLLDAQLPGLHGPWFLAEQFRRLAKHGIDVYWSGASLETRGRWPAHLDVPTNVHRLTADGAGILHGRNGHPLARLLTLPGFEAPPPPTDAVFTIAVQPRCEEIPDSLASGIDFWALGGRPDYETLQVGEVVAHFAGSPQGRSPQESGRHSCSVVHVDADGAVRIQPHFTDLVRWHQSRLTIDDEVSWSGLEDQLSQQQRRLRLESQVELHIVHWTVQGSGAAFERLLHPRFRAELISRLNHRRSGNDALTWTMAVDPVVAPQQLARWRQQNTPLGAYLRELDELAPRIDGMFGTSTVGPHPLGSMNKHSQQQILQHAVRDGLYWLGADQQTLRSAG
jgi:DNA repair protein SbcD/Mre11